MKKSKLKEYCVWYLLLLIPIAGTIVFNVYPLFQTITDSFQNMKNTFIGTVNYDILLKDAEFGKAVINTLYMALLGVGLNVPIAFILANMLNSIPVAKNVYKVVFLLPMIMSMVTVATLFKYLMMPDEQGIFNYLGSFLGFPPSKFLSGVDTARESLILMVVWKGVGYNIILFFAGLQAVPRELYEAAKMDGANEFKQWIYITIPSMKGTFTFVLITSTIAALKRFTDVYAVSGETGNPAGALSTIMLYIYRNSFSTLNYKDLGRASAASVILFLIILIITIMNFALTSGDNKETKVRKQKRGV